MIDLSSYARGLQKEGRERYVEKLKYDKGTKSLPDPYTLPPSHWGNDPYAWPELDFGQLFVYLIQTPGVFSTSAMKNYRSLEAYRYVESGHVSEVLFCNISESPFCFLTAGVLPSMRSRDQPHKPWVCLNKTSADVYCAHCTCMAGLGESSSHVAALLFKIELGVRFGLTSKSVTSEACRWNQVSTKEVQCSTIMELQPIMNTNRKKLIKSVVPSSRDPLPSVEVVSSLYLVCPNAAFFKSIHSVHPYQENRGCRLPVHQKSPALPVLLTSLYDEKYSTYSEDELRSTCDTIFKDTKCSKEQTDLLFCRTKGQNVSKLWFSHRKGRVTGTKAHDIWTLRDSTCRDNIIMRVMDYKHYDLSKKEAIRWGIDQEERARNFYVDHQRELHESFSCDSSGFKISSKNAFFGATADGIIQCICCGKGTLEVKCPYNQREMTVQEAVTDSHFFLDINFKLKEKHRYYSQVQWQMFVFDFSYCDFVVMTIPKSGPSLTITRVHRNENFIKSVSEKCSQFVQKHVVRELLTKKLYHKLTDDNQPSDDDLLWCICQEPEHGKMIFCDNSNCKIGWFHYSCVDIRRKPCGKWFCKACKKVTTS